ncbi:hypothetical protein HY629_01770, partial [Candidatus Uhrbacteria bacterium]|nr:hypothetical protein [Candidatus Uhrbacteria bacterium]
MLFQFFTFDPSLIEDVLFDIAAGNPFSSMWLVFKNGGWIVILGAILRVAYKYYLYKAQGKFLSKVKWVLLAIDVPRNNEQGPKAVENIFSHLAGAHGSSNWYQAKIAGESQLWFSLEIVSIDGYVQFMVRTPIQFRDLVESAIYAQYPDAEIQEVDDYTQYVPQRWPHPEYRMWGLEYKLFKPEAFPLRTHPEFEDKIAGEFKDPMAALMEALSALRKGEQVWIQYVITPVDDKWKDEAALVVKKLIGAKIPDATPAWYVRIITLPFTLLGFVWAGITENPASPEEKKKPELPTMMMHMSPGEKDTVAAIELKMTKIGFKTKVRFMYIARNEVYAKPRGVGSIMGALKQYNSVNLNRFTPCKKVWTQAYYVFTKARIARRQNLLFKAYSLRSNWRGERPKGDILNLEELASLWHFPV